MFIQLEEDWVEDDNKGLYAHFAGEDEYDGDTILFRIEDGYIFLYESQNGEFICKADGEYMTEENIALICMFLIKQYPDCEIECDLAS